MGYLLTWVICFFCENARLACTQIAHKLHKKCTQICVNAALLLLIEQILVHVLVSLGL